MAFFISKHNEYVRKTVGRAIKGEKPVMLKKLELKGVNIKNKFQKIKCFRCLRTLDDKDLVYDVHPGEIFSFAVLCMKSVDDITAKIN